MSEPKYSLGPSYDDKFEALSDNARIAELEAELERLRERYNDLIMQVARKHPNETRHDTAKRYIYDAEHQACQPTQSALLEKGE